MPSANMPRHEGDFALAAIPLFYDDDRQGALSHAHIGVIGVCPRPHRLTGVKTLLNGRTLHDSLIRQAAATAAEEVDPPDDLHGDAAYRRGLLATLVERGWRAASAGERRMWVSFRINGDPVTVDVDADRGARRGRRSYPLRPLRQFVRCTGYVPIVEAMLEARATYRKGDKP